MSDAADRAHDRHRMLLRAASGVSRGSPGMSAIAEEPDEPVVENSFWNLEDLDGAVWDPDLSDTEQAPDECTCIAWEWHENTWPVSSR